MNASNQEVTEASVQRLHTIVSSSDDDDGSGEAVLTQANGTVILDRHIETTTSSYMRTFSSFAKCGVPVELSIGFVFKVQCYASLNIIYFCPTGVRTCQKKEA